MVAVDLVQEVAHAVLVVLCITFLGQAVPHVQEPRGQLQVPVVVQVKK